MSGGFGCTMGLDVKALGWMSPGTAEPSLHIQPSAELLAAEKEVAKPQISVVPVAGAVKRYDANIDLVYVNVGVRDTVLKLVMALCK